MTIPRFTLSFGLNFFSIDVKSYNIYHSLHSKVLKIKYDVKNEYYVQLYWNISMYCEQKLNLKTIFTQTYKYFSCMIELNVTKN